MTVSLRAQTLQSAAIEMEWLIKGLRSGVWKDLGLNPFSITNQLCNLSHLAPNLNFLVNKMGMNNTTYFQGRLENSKTAVIHNTLAQCLVHINA